MENLGFWNIAQRSPNQIALITPEGERTTNAELLQSANQIVHALRERGFQPGDTVATVLRNEPAIIEIYLAIAQAGYYLVPINHNLVAPEIAYILQDSDAKILVCSKEFTPQCNNAMNSIDFPVEARFSTQLAEGFLEFSELKTGQPTDMPSDRLPGTVMNYTSGTTGKPKGVRRPIPEADPDSIATQLGMFLMLFGIVPEGENVHLCCSPLYHTAVLNFTTYSLHLGHTVVILPKWDAEEYLRSTQEYKVTHTHMVPTQFHRLLALPERTRSQYDISSLTHVIHGAAPCPNETKQKMLDWFGPVVYEYYAASEGGGTLATPQQWLKKPGSVGTPWPISQIKICDDNQEECPTGEIGTVYIKMGDISFKYHGDSDKTEKAWLDGFFTVGDAGYMDEDGYLYLCDRKSDMIISGGVNIYPAEIESALHQHDKIADVAVFGIPHSDWGEEVKGVVELLDGSAGTEDLAEDILAFCRANLAKYKCPKTIDFIQVMPRDPNGKLLKRKLREPYWENQERMI